MAIHDSDTEHVPRSCGECWAGSSAAGWMILRSRIYNDQPHYVFSLDEEPTLGKAPLLSIIGGYR